MVSDYFSCKNWGCLRLCVICQIKAAETEQKDEDKRTIFLRHENEQKNVKRIIWNNFNTFRIEKSV